MSRHITQGPLWLVSALVFLGCPDAPPSPADVTSSTSDSVELPVVDAVAHDDAQPALADVGVPLKDAAEESDGEHASDEM